MKTMFLRIFSVALFFLMGSISGCTFDAYELEPYLEAGSRPVFSTTEYAYAFKIPPGQKVSIVLPAYCLDFTKDTPSPTSRFVPRPVAVETDVQQLITLHRIMLENPTVFRGYFRQIPGLNILSKETYSLETTDGSHETVRFPLKASLDEALQMAIWYDDPGAQEEWNELHKRRKKQIENIRSALEDLNKGTPVDKVLGSIEEYDLTFGDEMDGLIKDDTSGATLRKALELALGRFILEGKQDVAEETLGSLMYETL